MKTNRRRFFQTVGAGVGGLGLSAALPPAAAAAQAKKVIKAGDTFPDRVGAGRKKQMWPIQSEMKSRRLKFDAPQDPISWAYMKELREHDKTKKVYPINPYVEVYQFRDNLYALLTENNDGGDDVWMFLL